jgi:FkbM family methyltransferase
VVDAGAHQGLFTLLAIKHLKARKVLAIEPEESNVLKLAINIALNKADDYITCINCALGTHDYIGTLHVSELSHLHTIISGCNHVRGKVKVRIFKLDTLAKMLNVDFIDLLKLDGASRSPQRNLDVSKDCMSRKLAVNKFLNHAQNEETQGSNKLDYFTKANRLIGVVNMERVWSD